MAQRGSAWLDIKGIVAKVRAAEREALEEIGDRVAADARRRAPIRKVFKERKGYRRKTRLLTPREQDIATRRAVHYYRHVQPDEFKLRRATAHIRNYAIVAGQRKGSANSLAASRHLRQLGIERNGRFTSTSGAFRLPIRKGGGFEPGPKLNDLLTARGRYEIRSGRAIHRASSPSGTRVQVGGALKASIESEGVRETSSGQEVVVTAAIRYAKFVEFPTIHNAAQPFLRPALQQERSKAVKTLATRIGEALGR
jgi:HK97 gp10 family phage protein